MKQVLAFVSTALLLAFLFSCKKDRYGTAYDTPFLTITPKDTAIMRGGTVSISYTATNTETLKIDGVSTTLLSGTLTTDPITSDKKIVFSAYGRNGTVKRDTATVHVYTEHEILSSIPPGKTGVWKCIMRRYYKNGAYHFDPTPFIKVKFFSNGILLKYVNNTDTSSTVSLTWEYKRDAFFVQPSGSWWNGLRMGQEDHPVVFYAPDVFLRLIPADPSLGISGNYFEETFWKY